MQINDLSNSTNFDIYGINAAMLKLASLFISEVLSHIFNECISQGIFPNKLKVSMVVPVYMKGKKSKFSNYCPIFIATQAMVCYFGVTHQVYSGVEASENGGPHSDIE